ncbi:hypothetical protein [Arthrobacter roseus]|uniref:hypothetical protein n=1 Tax=Arthrobacter roseus TaxID=136274 RepID=UPI0019624797|nr:hypothetical protein [Arthrobacter roseus]MBM7849548.1 hypothetical protein [Arthrobacter roseus]
MDGAAADLAEDARGLATACTSYAASVEQAHEELRQEAMAFAREVSALIIAGSILSFVTLGGAGAVAGIVGAGRTAAMVIRITSAISGLVAAARATNITIRATGYGAQFARLATAGSGRVQWITKPLAPAITNVTKWTDRGSAFIGNGPLSMSKETALLGVEKTFWGKYASGDTLIDRSIHLGSFAAAGLPLTFKSIKWGKAAYDRLESAKEVKGVIESGKLP